MKTQAEIEALELVGVIRNNWRQRTVKLYRSEDPHSLYMIGVPFAGGAPIISHEPIGLNERNAMDYWQHGNKVLVRD